MKKSTGESLDRYYLLKLFGFGVFLHRIHHTDPADTYHDHPWNGISFILGRYREEFHDRPGKVHLRALVNFVRATRHHRTIVDKPVWTLFIHGRKCNRWSVVDLKGRRTETPWSGEVGHKSYQEALA